MSVALVLDAFLERRRAAPRNSRIVGPPAFPIRASNTRNHRLQLLLLKLSTQSVHLVTRVTHDFKKLLEILVVEFCVVPKRVRNVQPLVPALAIQVAILVRKTNALRKNRVRGWVVFRISDVLQFF